MIEKYNIPIHRKNIKQINYQLNLDTGFWSKQEYDSGGNEIYYGNSNGRIYYIKDDR
jgi:hypothetical protein